MNEKFLSRGKRKDNGEWVTGYYVPLALGSKYHNICTGRLAMNVATFEHFGVIPETAGRCTGLTDKNDTLIFEGDILRYGGNNYEVIFEQRHNAAYFGLVYSPTETIAFDDYFDLSRAEIIGNIHDNPKLIGGVE